jgi:hypothetical protein
VAFYADCRHEVLPVKSGYRITLTYNLHMHRDASRPEGDDGTAAEQAGCETSSRSPTSGRRTARSQFTRTTGTGAEAGMTAATTKTTGTRETRAAAKARTRSMN